MINIILCKEMGGSQFVSASASSQELRQSVSVLPLSQGIMPTTHVSSPESYDATCDERDAVEQTAPAWGAHPSL